MKRREFVTGVAAAGIGQAARASNRVLGANERINIAFIGVGLRGAYLAQNFAALGESQNCQIVMVCDLWQRRVTEGAARHKCRGTMDYREILHRKDVDAVIIATPDHWHAPLAIAAAQSGKDVYLEKPMCHTIEEAKRLVQVVRETERIVQVGSQTCSSAHWYKTRDAIAGGAIGQMVMSQGSYHGNNARGVWNSPVYVFDPEAGPSGKGDNYVDWNTWLGSAPKRHWDPDRFFRFRKYWDYSGGIATDLFFHVAAPLNICWGEPQFPFQVMASGGNFVFKDSEVPDTFHLMAVYPKGHSLVLTSTQTNSMHIPGSIRGHLGSIIMTDVGHFEDLTDHITFRPEKRMLESDERFKAYREKFGVEERQIPVSQTHNVKAHIGNFLECVRSRRKPNLDVDSAARSQVLVSMSVQSYLERTPVYFDESTWKVSAAPPART